MTIRTKDYRLVHNPRERDFGAKDKSFIEENRIEQLQSLGYFGTG